MYRLPSSIEKVSAGSWASTTKMHIRPLEKELQDIHKSYCLMKYNGNEPISPTPENLQCKLSSLHYSNKKIAWPMHHPVNIFGMLSGFRAFPFGEDVLKMVEHCAALTPLTQTPLLMEFSNSSTIYDAKTLENITKEILSTRQTSDNTYMTIDREFVYKGQTGDIIIKPSNEQRLTVEMHVDYSDWGKYSWVGKQRAFFDSSVDGVYEFAGARTIETQKWYRMLCVNASKRNELTNNWIIGQDMNLNEVAMHKILDFLATCNLGQFFLAADIVINKAGHVDHLSCMQELPYERKFLSI